MATKMTVVYECKECGTEVTVNSAGLNSVDPIYCCGLPLFKKVKAAVNAAKTNKTRSKEKSDNKEARNTANKLSKKKMFPLCQ